MRPALKQSALLALLLLACGPAPREGAKMGFHFTLSAALADTIGELQVSLLSKGKSLAGGDCLEVQKTCLISRTDVTTDRFIKVQDAMGVEHLALRFPLNLTAGAVNSTQDVSLNGVPLGKDYALVIEALSKGSPPLLVGSSCQQIAEVTAGTNTRVLANTIKPLGVPVNCDPRIEK